MAGENLHHFFILGDASQVNGGADCLRLCGVIILRNRPYAEALQRNSLKAQCKRLPCCTNPIRSRFQHRSHPKPCCCNVVASHWLRCLLEGASRLSSVYHTEDAAIEEELHDQRRRLTEIEVALDVSTRPDVNLRLCASGLSCSLGFVRLAKVVCPCRTHADQITFHRKIARTVVAVPPSSSPWITFHPTSTTRLPPISSVPARPCSPSTRSLRLRTPRSSHASPNSIIAS